MDYDVSNLDKLTASNVAPGSATLLVHSACMWAVTLYAFRVRGGWGGPGGGLWGWMVWGGRWV